MKEHSFSPDRSKPSASEISAENLETQEVERPEPLEELSRESETISTEQTASLERIEKTGQDLDLSPETVAEEIKQSGLQSFFESIRARATSLVEDAGIAIRISLVGSTLFFGSEAVAQTPQPENSSKSETEVTMLTEAEVRDAVIKDEGERSFVILGDNPSAMIQLESGDGNYTTFDLSRIEALAKEHGSEEVILAHTHPLGAYDVASNNMQEILRKIRSGERAMLPPMPPSAMDIATLIGTEDYMRRKGVRAVKERVFATTGIYEYSGGEESTLFKLYHAFSNRVTDITASFLESLSPRLMKRIEAIRDDTHRNYLVFEKIQSDPELAKALTPFLRKIKALEKTFGPTMEKIGELDSIGAASMFYLEVNPEYSEKMREKYLQALRAEKINIEFTPYAEAQEGHGAINP